MVSSVASSSSSSAPCNADAEKKVLAQLMARYRADQSHGGSPSALSNLAKQIMTAARAAGQNVTLPAASGNAAAAAPASGAPVVAAPALAGNVNVTA